jgi:hypothetical protein
MVSPTNSPSATVDYVRFMSLNISGNNVFQHDTFREGVVGNIGVSA